MLARRCLWEVAVATIGYDGNAPAAAEHQKVFFCGADVANIIEVPGLLREATAPNNHSAVAFESGKARKNNVLCYSDFRRG